MTIEKNSHALSPLLRAGNYHRDGDLAKAVEFYKISLQHDPANPHALFFLGLAEWRLHGPDFGIEWMERGLAVDCDVPEGQYNVQNVVVETLAAAIVRHQAGRLAEAAPLYRRILRLDPDHGEALHLLGLVERRIGDIGLGLSLLGRAFQINPDIQGLRHNLGMAVQAAFALAVDHHQAGRLDEAGVLYGHILNAQPELPEARTNFQSLVTHLLNEAVNHHRAGRFAQATHFYSHVLRLDPDHGEALHLLGLAERRTGDLGQGLSLMGRALRINPDIAGLRHNLGVAIHDAFALAVDHHKAGRLDEAGALYGHILNAQPELPEARANFQSLVTQLLEEGLVHHRVDRFAQAAPLYRRILRLAPDHAQALHLLGLAEWRTGDIGAGLALIAQALEQDPAIAGGRANLESVVRAACGAAGDLYGAGRFEEAAALLGHVFRAKPEQCLSPEGLAILQVQARSTAGQLFNARRLTIAEKLNDWVLRSFPSADGFHLAASIAVRRRDHYMAIENFRKAIEADPSRSAYYVELGTSLRASGRTAEAASAFREGLERDAGFQEQRRIIASKSHAVRTPIPTLLFCTSYVDTEELWNSRYSLWKSYYERPGVIDGAIRMIDDCGRYDPPNRGSWFHRFDHRLGRHSNADFPGWWRSFLFSVQLARKEGFRKIVHIESDAFVLSKRMMDHINGLDEGWTAFWCPIWQIPESAIQVIGYDQFDKIEELARMDRADPFFLGGAEYILPFTNVVKVFKGDRYAEYTKTAPEDVDYICQIDGPIKDRLVADLAAGNKTTLAV